jgi:hypothetical protein
MDGGREGGREGGRKEGGREGRRDIPRSLPPFHPPSLPPFLPHPSFLPPSQSKERGRKGDRQKASSACADGWALRGFEDMGAWVLGHPSCGTLARRTHLYTMRRACVARQTSGARHTLARHSSMGHGCWDAPHAGHVRRGKLARHTHACTPGQWRATRTHAQRDSGAPDTGTPHQHGAWVLGRSSCGACEARETGAPHARIHSGNLARQTLARHTSMGAGTLVLYPGPGTRTCERHARMHTGTVARHTLARHISMVHGCWDTRPVPRPGDRGHARDTQAYTVGQWRATHCRARPAWCMGAGTPLMRGM